MDGASTVNLGRAVDYFNEFLIN